MGLLAPEGRLRALLQEPVRPLVEPDPTVRRGTRQQPLVASHQPLTHHLLGFASFPLTGRLLSELPAVVPVAHPPDA